MKLIAKVAPLVIFSTLAQAQGVIEVDLKTSTDVNFQERVHYKHSVKCYWKKKGDDIFPQGSTTINQSSGIIKFNKSTNHSISVSNSKFINYRIRNFGLNIEINNTLKSSTLSMNLSDSITSSHTAGYDTSGCRTSSMTARAGQAKISGKISFKYKVPQNVWLVKVTRSNYEGQFSFGNTSSLQGGLNESDNNDKEIFIWSKPGDELIKEFNIPTDTVTGKNNLGHFNMSFEPVGIENISNEEIENSWIEVKNYLETKENDFKNLSQQNRDKFFLNNAATLIRNKNLLGTYLKEISTTVISDISKKLYELAQTEIPQAKELELHVRSMAAVLSYEIAKIFLNDIQVYCKKISIDLPFIQKSQNVMGLRAAHYWMSRAANRIKYYDYVDLESFLGEIARYENDGLTYKEIMENDNVRKKLRKAYKLLVSSRNYLKTPYRAALNDVDNLLVHFRSVGSGVETTSRIKGLLKEGAESESAFIKDVFASLYVFQKKKDEKIVISPILNRLEHFQEVRDELIDLMNNNTRFLSIENNHSTDSFLAELESIMSHQINIFSHELNIEFFEPIRETFYSSQSVSSLVDITNQCILGGVK